MQLPNAVQTSTNLYETDFYAWTQQQAELIRTGQWEQIDRSNLIEEVESLGRQQRQELRNRLSILIGHLLKWQYQPQQRSRSWLATIRVQRRDIARLLRDNPSLQPDLEAAVTDAYENGRDLAMGETDLPVDQFPATCSYSMVELLEADFYPGEVSELV